MNVPLIGINLIKTTLYNNIYILWHPLHARTWKLYISDLHNPLLQFWQIGLGIARGQFNTQFSDITYHQIKSVDPGLGFNPIRNGHIYIYAAITVYALLHGQMLLQSNSFLALVYTVNKYNLRSQLQSSSSTHLHSTLIYLHC